MMAEGAWAHTAHLLHMLYDCNRDPKKSQAVSPDAFNPYGSATRRVSKARIPKAGIEALKIFLRGN